MLADCEAKKHIVEYALFQGIDRAFAASPPVRRADLDDVLKLRANLKGNPLDA